VKAPVFTPFHFFCRNLFPLSTVYPSEMGVPRRAARTGADERLLVEAAQADPARFADLYEIHFERVYAFIASRVRNRQEAEDLTSEVFRHALQNLKRFEWRGVPFSAWLMRIAANMMADRWQRVARDAGEAPPDPPDAAATEDIERRALLYQLIDTLPADQRRVVVARFVEEKSIRDLAQELGRSEGAIKQLQFRALEALRERTHPPSKPGAPGGRRAHA
jgi:RNA polymerase sigma-70 factor, ECF subfamily